MSRRRLWIFIAASLAAAEAAPPKELLENLEFFKHLDMIETLPAVQTSTSPLRAQEISDDH